MPAGTEIFNADRTIKLSITDRITRIMSYHVTTPNVAGSLVVPDVGAGQAFFAVLTTPHYPYNSVNTTALPTFSRSGNVISWTAAPGQAQFMIGAF